MSEELKELCTKVDAGIKEHGDAFIAAMREAAGKQKFDRLHLACTIDKFGDAVDEYGKAIETIVNPIREQAIEIMRDPSKSFDQKAAAAKAAVCAMEVAIPDWSAEKAPGITPECTKAFKDSGIKLPAR